MYSGVPMIAPVVVRDAAPVATSLAMPKSSSLTRSPPGPAKSGTSMTLPGLRSR